MTLTQFDNIQRKLRPLWETISHLNDVEQTIVVVPSYSFDSKLLEQVADIIPFLEERMLFLLFLLRQPRARVVFLSSKPIRDEIIDYYLSLLPGIIPEQARRRLHLVSPNDDSATPLSQKILASDSLIKEVRRLILDPERAHIVPYITTELERDLTVALGIPMYGCDPRHLHLGSKSWSRQIFEEEGVPHPRGRNHLHNVDEAAEAIRALKRAHPEIGTFVLKLDSSAGGVGNVILDVADMQPDATLEDVRKRIESIDAGEQISPAHYLETFSSGGGIVEELITGTDIRSPSVQLRITPLGEVEVLSTHDQLLGGSSGQSYLGCVFPADPAYARHIIDPAKKIGQRLAREGVLGRFAVDFIVVQDNSGWDGYAIEINLRKGGTTHPFLTMQFLTNGTYDPTTADFITPRREPRFLIATDHAHTHDPTSIEDLFDEVVLNNLHFDNATQTGVVFHMLGGLEKRMFGLTAVHKSPQQVKELFDQSISVLQAELQGLS